MCGSSNYGRNAAFQAAATFFKAQMAAQLGDLSKPAIGETSQLIAQVAAFGGPEAPPEIVNLAEAEDRVAALVREAQLGQQGIIERLLSGLDVRSGGSRVEAFVATLNNLSAAIEANNAALAVAEDAAKVAQGTITDAPSTLQ